MRSQHAPSIRLGLWLGTFKLDQTDEYDEVLSDVAGVHSLFQPSQEARSKIALKVQNVGNFGATPLPLGCLAKSFTVEVGGRYNPAHSAMAAKFHLSSGLWV